MEENTSIEVETNNATESTPVEEPKTEEKDTHVKDGIIAGAIAAVAAVFGVAASIVGAVFTKKSKDAFSK